MTIEIIVSTMNNVVDNLDQSLINYEKLSVINQVPDKLNNHRNDNIIHGIKWINIDQIGLSRSRNLGIDISTSEYVYLTDDDIVIDKKFEQIIEKQIIKFPETDIFAFQVSGINENFKKYPTKIKNIGFLRSLKLSS